jgi:hypothetical protein
VFTDGESLLIADPAAIYLYHVACGGVKMFHLLCCGGKEAQEIVDSLEMTPLCRCYRPPVRFVGTSTPDPVQQTLANVFVGLGTCPSLKGVALDEVRLMLEEMASREEMRELGQML